MDALSMYRIYYEKIKNCSFSTATSARSFVSSSNDLSSLRYLTPSSTSLHSRLSSILALDLDVPHPIHQGSVKLNDKSFQEWDSLTTKFSGATNVPFLLLQHPQIILNVRNLMAVLNFTSLWYPLLSLRSSGDKVPHHSFVS